MPQVRSFPEGPGGTTPDKIAPNFYLGRWASAAGVALLAGVLGYSLYTNPNIDHAVIREFLFSRTILDGLWMTIQLAVISQIIGIVLGLAIALMRMARNPVAAAVGWVYIWIFRGVPLLVQVLIWGNFALFYRTIDIGIPGTSFSLWSWDTNALITAYVASLLALSLNEAAYMAEIIRGGFLSVKKGQYEATAALGMSPASALFRVILPQILRVITPPTGNQFISMLKMTSLVSVIAGGDLLTQAQNISAVNLHTMELLFVASLWYLLCTTVASLGQSLLERRLGQGRSRP